MTARRGREHLVDFKRSAEIYLVIRDHKFSLVQVRIVSLLLDPTQPYGTIPLFQTKENQMYKKITCSLIVLSAVSMTAHARDNDFIATTMMMACPETSHIQVNDAGYTALAEPQYQKKTEQCLRQAYLQAAMNPFPVSPTAVQPATRVRVQNGKIILY